MKGLREASKALPCGSVSTARYGLIKHTFPVPDAYKKGQIRRRPNTEVWCGCGFYSEKWKHRPKRGLFSGDSEQFRTIHRSHFECRWCCNTKSTADWRSVQAPIRKFSGINRPGSSIPFWAKAYFRSRVPLRATVWLLIVGQFLQTQENHRTTNPFRALCVPNTQICSSISPPIGHKLLWSSNSVSTQQHWQTFQLSSHVTSYLIIFFQS